MAIYVIQKHSRGNAAFADCVMAIGASAVACEIVSISAYKTFAYCIMKL